MNEEQLKSALGNTNVTAEWGIIASLTSGSTSESEMQFVSIVKLKNEQLIKICDTFNVSADYLLGRQEF